MSTPKEPIDPKSVDPHAPLRLSKAAEIAFPFGGMTTSGLRREIARGTLEAEIIAGKMFVSLDAIERMRVKCREPIRARVEEDRRISETMQAMRTADRERRHRIASAANLGMTEAELALATLQRQLQTDDDEFKAQAGRDKEERARARAQKRAAKVALAKAEARERKRR